MSSSTLLMKLWMVTRRDFLTAARYRMGFWLQAFGVAAELAAFFYLALAIGPGFRPEGVGYFPFLVVGTALHGFLVMGVNQCVSTIHDAQVTGTMEVLMTTSTPAPVIVFLSTFSTFAGRTLHLLLYLAAGFFLFSVSPEQTNLPGCLLVYLLTLVLAVAVGIAAAAIQVLTQKGGGVVVLLSALGWFLSGAVFPVSVLPHPLRDLANLFPMTYSLRGMRLALLRGAPFSELAEPIAVLALFCAILLPAGLYLFSHALRRARQSGSLSFY